jgi:Mn-dependent DtxR family transcriptional regulator
MAHFTAKQGRYLAFIYAYTELHGFPPAEAEIASALLVSPPSVNQMVMTLEKKGLILSPRNAAFHSRPGAGIGTAALGQQT